MRELGSQRPTGVNSVLSCPFLECAYDKKPTGFFISEIGLQHLHRWRASRCSGEVCAADLGTLAGDTSDLRTDSRRGSTNRCQFHPSGTSKLKLKPITLCERPFAAAARRRPGENALDITLTPVYKIVRAEHMAVPVIPRGTRSWPSHSADILMFRPCTSGVAAKLRRRFAEVRDTELYGP